MRKAAVVALGIVDREVQSAAFFAQGRALDDEIGDGEQVAQLDQVPREQEVPVIGVDLGFEHFQPAARALESAVAADNAHVIPHEVADLEPIGGDIDLLLDLLLVRRLPAWHRNVGKRLVKSPKVYVRDSGITHALLGIRNREELLGHPVIGQSWEGFVIETLLTVAPQGTEAHFYRTTAGAEIDLVLTLPGGQLWALEIKRSSAPKLERGFHFACADLKPHKRFVVYPGDERFPLDADTVAIGLNALAKLLEKEA